MRPHAKARTPRFPLARNTKPSRCQVLGWVAADLQATTAVSDPPWPGREAPFRLLDNCLDDPTLH